MVAGALIAAPLGRCRQRYGLHDVVRQFAGERVVDLAEQAGAASWTTSPPTAPSSP